MGRALALGLGLVPTVRTTSISLAAGFPTFLANPALFPLGHPCPRLLGALDPGRHLDRGPA